MKKTGEAMDDGILTAARILLVDDDVGMLCLLENVLHRLRFKNIRKLRDSTRILDEFEAYQPDLVITDIEMPQLDGIQLVELLRKHLPQEDCLPILVLTGSPNSQHKRRALHAGATDLMLKPFDSAEIQMRIRSLLRTRFQHFQIQAHTRELEGKVRERTGELQAALVELRDSQRQVIQQERFRAFGEMAGGVVHDFNNTLMTVIGYSGLLLQDEALLDDRELLRNYLKMMNTAGRDASHVVSRLRDFYRPREETDAFVAVEINDVIEEIVPLTKPKWHGQALETGRTIRVELELEKVPLVLGNGAELRESLTNLVFNAVDAMPDGGTITFRSAAVPDGVKIEISDTGTGMTDEVRNRCLEPFFSTKGESGTGLGLSMVFGIIRRHSGVLDIESAPGAGTTFRITLPLHRPVPAAGQVTALKPDHSLRVLVVDDEPSAREVISGYLRNDGHRPSTACDGEEALERVLQEDFDLVIADLGMPGMDGIQLANTMRLMDPEKGIILVTGFAFSPDRQSKSVSCVLKKPLGPDELRSAVASMARQ